MSIDMAPPDYEPNDIVTRRQVAKTLGWLVSAGGLTGFLMACKLISDPPKRVVEPSNVLLEPIPLVDTREFRNFLTNGGFTRKDGQPIEINFAWPKDKNTPRTYLQEKDKRKVGEMIVRGIKFISGVFGAVPNPTDLHIVIVPSMTGIYRFQAGNDASPNPVGTITMENGSSLDAWVHEFTHPFIGINDTRFGESAAILAARLANNRKPVFDSSSPEIQSKLSEIDKQIASTDGQISLPKGTLLYYQLETAIWQIYENEPKFPTTLASELQSCWGSDRIRPSLSTIGKIFSNAAGFNNIQELSGKYPIYSPRVSIQPSPHG